MIIFTYIDPGSGFSVMAAGGGLIALLAGFFGFILAFLRRILEFLKKHWRKLLGVLMVFLLTLGGYLLCPHTYKSKFEDKIIVLGMDGLSADILEVMMDRGQLPNFSNLAEIGSYSRLETTNPAQSPVAWATFSTGKNPGKTGVFDFIHRDPASYGLSLSLTQINHGKPVMARKAKAFWEYLSHHNIPLKIIGCPLTFPPEKIKGQMLSGMGTPDILGTQGTFSYYSTDVANDHDVGGHLATLMRRGSVFVSEFRGPRVSDSKLENMVVSFELSSVNERNATLSWEGKKMVLEKGVWSPWIELRFKDGLTKRIKGIAKAMLIEGGENPELYVSPINIHPDKPWLPISYPSNYAKKIAQEIGLFHTLGMPMPTWGLNEKRIDDKAFVEITQEILDERKAMLFKELDRFENGLFFMYFESPDIIQHMFWRYIDGDHPLHSSLELSEYKNLIYDWYVKMDEILGAVIAQSGSKTQLLVLSDHGFGTFRRAVHINSWLRNRGYLVLHEDFGRDYFDSDQEEGVGKEFFENVDWSRTVAYAAGFGGIYLNLEGREGKGIVSVGGEKDELIKEIKSELLLWVDSQTNKKVVRTVYESSQIYDGNYQVFAPDIVLGFESGYRASWQTALGAAPNEVIEDNQKAWSGTHLVDPDLVPGVLLSNVKLDLKSPSLVDIAPTLLTWAGVDGEKIESYGFDGLPLLKKRTQND